MEYVLNHGMESSHRINNIQAKAEHTEQVKIENTELRLRVNDLETQLHDIQLKYEETKSRERNGFDYSLAKASFLSSEDKIGCRQVSTDRHVSTNSSPSLTEQFGDQSVRNNPRF